MSAQALGWGDLDTSRPFTTTEAYASGLDDRALASDRFVRVFHGVHVGRDVTRTLAVRAEAALRIAPPSAVVSHHTAALLWGGVVPPQSVVHLTVPAGQDCRVDGIRTHRFRDHDGGVLRRGLRVTGPERTFCDLGRQLDLVELVTLGDRLVRRGVTSPDLLLAAAQGFRGAHVRVVRRAAGLVRMGVDSPPESRLRMLVVLAGLPEPTVNHVLRDPGAGDWQRRFELAYDELRLAIEYQGRWHRQTDEAWGSDVLRRDDLDRRGWRVVEILAAGLDEEPLRTLQRIEAARRERGGRPVTRFAEEWRAYFPARSSGRP